MAGPFPTSRSRGYQDDVLVVEHAPSGGVVGPRAILILPPLGYEDTSAYRPLRGLAEVLAAQGHLVQRLDWPGLGGSAGDHDSEGLVEACLEAIRLAHDALLARGFTEVAAIGVRAGGLLALGARIFDELVLWGLPASGSRYLRSEKVFHQLAEKSFSEPPPWAQPLPAGAVEAGGFVYSAQTVAGLGSLDSARLVADHPPRRVLLIPRDGISVPRKVLEALAGAEVVVREELGLVELLDNAYHASLAPGVRDSVVDFLGPVDPGFSAPAAELAPTLSLGGGVEERIWLGSTGAGELSGVLCLPPGGPSPGAAWTIFFNAGGIRRSGPNRLWTRAARALAAQGRPSLRFDVRDVGDSDGTLEPHADLEEMYSSDSVADGLTAVDAVLAMGAGSVDVVGLCSGAFMGAQVAAQRSIRSALLFNGLAFVWDEDARASSMTAHIGASLLDRRRWGRLLTGRIDARRLARAVAAKGRLQLGEAAARLRGEAPAGAVQRLLGEVQARGTRLHLVSSAGDPSIAYLERQVPEALRPRLTVFPGVDHTIRPAWAHGAVVDFICALPQAPSMEPSP